MYTCVASIQCIPVAAYHSYMHMYCLAFAVSDVPKRVSGFRKPFASLATYNGRIYALRKMMQQPTAIGAAYSWVVGLEPKCLLYVYQYDSNTSSLTQEKVIRIPMQDKACHPTVSVRNGRIKVALDVDSKVIHYSLNGTYQSGVVMNCKDGYVMNCPYISDDDPAGNLLMADRGSNSIVVMEPRTLVVRRLEIEPEVRHPRAAVVFMNRLYVTSTHDDTINVFEPVDKW